MSLYKKKDPGIVEAKLFLEGELESIITWCDGNGGITFRPPDKFVWVELPNLQGRAAPGDWIVKNSDGEFSAVTTEEFEQTYEPIEW